MRYERSSAYEIMTLTRTNSCLPAMTTSSANGSACQEGQLAHLVELGQGRHQLAGSQVAAGAEDD